MKRRLIPQSEDKIYIRLYLLPIILFVVLFFLFGFITMDQRDQEIEGTIDRLQLLTGLLAEKISSKLNTFEMTLELIEVEAAKYDLDLSSDRDLLNLIVRQQMFMHPEVEGVLLLFDEGDPSVAAVGIDTKAAGMIRQSMVDRHVTQEIPFTLFTYTEHGAKHLVVSRRLMDRQRELKAMVALVVDTDRFFEVLDVSLSPGITSAVMFDNHGDLFAIWDNPHDEPFGNAIPIEMTHIDQLTGFKAVTDSMVDDSTLLGGIRVNRRGDTAGVFAQTENFPMTLGVLLHIPTALAVFDRSVMISVMVIIVLMAVALTIDHQLVRKTKANDRLRQQMVDELSVQVQQRTAELERMLGRDSLTGLMNRHFCNEEMEKAIGRHESEGISFCVIGIDLDGFKEVNDTWGHLMGDKILIHITSILIAAVGSLGLVSRWGGDELLVLLPDCSLDNGMEIAWRLCMEVDRNPYSDDIHCTISSGVAQHRIGETATSLIHRSDAAMYKAKSAGKNCVKAADVN